MITDPVTVLFVDDEPAILRGIRRTLQGSPFEVLSADDGHEALELMRRRRIDVLVSDIDMPEMSGLDLVKLVRREFPGTLRMLLTGSATMDRTLNAINEGEVARFFTKPFDPELFRGTVTGLVARIEKLRADGEIDARRARREEFFRWVEERFPGATNVTKNDDGEVVIEVRAALAAADAEGSAVREQLVPRGDSANPPPR